MRIFDLLRCCYFYLRRKKRKWDQPAESFLSSGIAVHGVLPSCNMTSLGGVGIASVAALAPVSSVNCATLTQVIQYLYRPSYLF